MDLSLSSRLEEWNSSTVAHSTSAIPVPHWHVEKWTCLGGLRPASAFKTPRNRNLFPRVPTWSAARTSQGVEGTDNLHVPKFAADVDICFFLFSCAEPASGSYQSTSCSSPLSFTHFQSFHHLLSSPFHCDSRSPLARRKEDLPWQSNAS